MNKSYACSDLHGNYNLWKQISDYCDYTDTIYILGDAIDRGKDGLKLMLALLGDSRVNYLMGNHETMMAASISEYFYDYNNYSNKTYLWMCNGGQETYEALQQYDVDFQISLLKEILNLPYYIYLKDKNIVLCHSGCDYEQLLTKEDMKNNYLWNREHLTHEWDGPEYLTMIHGHTPVQSILGDKTIDPEIYKYCNGHKIDIDLGCFYSKKTALLDLDTLEPIYFYDKGEEKENE